MSQYCCHRLLVHGHVSAQHGSDVQNDGFPPFLDPGGLTPRMRLVHQGVVMNMVLLYTWCSVTSPLKAAMTAASASFWRAQKVSWASAISPAMHTQLLQCRFLAQTRRAHCDIPLIGQMITIMVKLLRSRIAFGNIKLTVRLSGWFIGVVDVRNVTARRCVHGQHSMTGSTLCCIG